MSFMQSKMIFSNPASPERIANEMMRNQISTAPAGCQNNQGEIDSPMVIPNEVITPKDINIDE